MRMIHVLCALSLLASGAVLTSSPAGAAPWISGADSYAAPWVHEIEQELLKKDYRYVLGNDPRTPQASVLKLLNRAAIAYQADDTRQAQALVNEAIDVLEEGVRKHYYSQSDVEPILNSIRQHAPVETS